jgi:energy-coupling factor transport system ATP-binding protein
VIRFEEFSFWYPNAADPTLRDVDLSVADGELALLVGMTGSGKSTLLRAVNGLVPSFTGGHVEGAVRAAGLDTRTTPPREFASAVGVVGQDPLAGFVTDTVEEELAYAMEQLATPPPVMRRRVEEVLDLLGIAPLRRRALRSLSGGEQQRVAIGSVLTAMPSILVLDEPTSALDPVAAEEALAAVLRLVHDVGITVLAAEHRLERVVEYADQLVVLDGGFVRSGAPRAVLESSPLAPPVVELGRLAGWSPLPLSVREARRAATQLRERLAGATPPTRPTVVPGDASRDGLVCRSLVVQYGSTVAVRGADVDVGPGEVVALMGRNGSGKSSLLWALRGAVKRAGGSVTVGGLDPSSMSRANAGAAIALVPQQATDLLYHASVDAECATADRAADRAVGSTRELFERLTGTQADGAKHPRDLSDGQRLALALAVQLVGGARALLLDEPTRGLDYDAKGRLGATLAELAAEGHAIVVATHDVEFAAHIASRVVVMAEGEIVTDAPAREALAASPVFAPQVAKVMAPLGFLTVEQVAQAVRAEATSHG